MFKKFSIGALAFVVFVLGITGTVLAQESEPPFDGVCPYGTGCGGYGMGGLGYNGSMPGIVAEALGITVGELSAALADEQTVAEIATAQGVELADVIAALIAPRVERLQQAVADGNMTQEQVDSLIDEMTEHMLYRLENLGLGYHGDGSGGCGMMGGGSYGRSSGMRGGHGGGMQRGGWSGGADTSNLPARSPRF